MSNSIVILAKNIRIIDGLYSLNDLHKASGAPLHKRPKEWVKNQQTKELIGELLSEDGISSLEQNQPLRSIHGGTNQGTYACEDLVYAYAMWISAKFSLIVIRAFKAMQKPLPQITAEKISEEQRGILYDIVATRSGGNGSLRAKLWGALKHHYKYSTYHDLLVIHFEDAKHLLETVDIGEQKAQQSYFLRLQDGREFDARLRSLFDLAGLLAKRGDDVAAVFQKQAREMNALLVNAK